LLTARLTSSLNGMADSLLRRSGLRRRIKLILVCGPWGSGTTAVAGMLAALGARGFGPYYLTFDPRTPNSYEFNPFRETVLRHACERTVTLKPTGARARRSDLRALHRRIEREEFGSYDVRGTVPVFFKYPLSALMIPDICEAFDTRLIYVVRPLEEIEQTRRRRGWGMQFGRAGAEILYAAMHRAAEAQSTPVLEIDFRRLVASRGEQANELAQFAGLTPTAQSLKEAVQFVRSEGSVGPNAHPNNSRTNNWTIRFQV